jgi:hypothetical protein
MMLQYIFPKTPYICLMSAVSLSQSPDTDSRRAHQRLFLCFPPDKFMLSVSDFMFNYYIAFMITLCCDYYGLDCPVNSQTKEHSYKTFYNKVAGGGFSCSLFLPKARRS